VKNQFRMARPRLIVDGYEVVKSHSDARITAYRAKFLAARHVTHDEVSGKP
jgi:hypothetical protein